MIDILICKKKNFIIIFLSVVHLEWNWRITLLSVLFEHCTCKWINIVQLLSCFDGSSYSRYLLAVRCIDASLLHPSLSSNYPLPNSRRALKMPIHAPRRISICVSLTLWIKDSIYNNTQIYRLPINLYFETMLERSYEFIFTRNKFLSHIRNSYCHLLRPDDACKWTL